MDWVKHMVKINEAVGEKNRLDKSWGKKLLVQNVTKNEFWKCIGCIILTVTYESKGQRILG